MSVILYSRTECQANGHQVCPYCCNCLTIARAPGTEDHPQGQNAFTCRTCPYQFILDEAYYERTYMKKKQKDVILGEEQSSLPVNDGKLKSERTASDACLTIYPRSPWWMPERELHLEEGVLLSTSDEERRRATHIVLQGESTQYCTLQSMEVGSWLMLY